MAKVDTRAGAQAAAELATKEAFDVLVVGGGPAGAAATAALGAFDHLIRETA